MKPYWINMSNLRIAVMPRPRGDDWLIDDLRILRESGTDVIASALTAEEVMGLGLTGEAQACVQNGLLFIQFPIEDRDLPTNLGQFDTFVNQLVDHVRKGRSVIIHCRAGIGRSSLIAVCVLTKMGLSAEQAFQAIAEARGCPVPDTPEQRKYLEQYSGEHLA
jgi:protein-tyrosine phosphatase